MGKRGTVRKEEKEIKKKNTKGKTSLLPPPRGNFRKPEKGSPALEEKEGFSGKFTVKGGKAFQGKIAKRKRRTAHSPQRGIRLVGEGRRA